MRKLLNEGLVFLSRDIGNNILKCSVCKNDVGKINQRSEFEKTNYKDIMYEINQG